MVARVSFNFSRICLGDANEPRRRSLHGVLVKNGYGNIIESDSLDPFVVAVTRGEVDLLICDVAIPDGDLNNLVHKMRHKEIGANPFILVLAMIENPTAATVQSAFDAGVDDILVMPFPPQQLIERLTILERGRKPFVVTYNYIGPDRRSKNREPAANDPELVSVPNPLRLKSTQNMDAFQMQGIIDTAAAQINNQKMERHAVQIRFLIDRIVAAGLTNGKLPTDDIAKLLHAAEDLGRRLRGTRYAHVAELAMSLVGLVLRIQRDGGVPHERDIALLPKLGQAIDRAFNSGAANAAMAREISGSVGSLTATKAAD